MVLLMSPPGPAWNRGEPVAALRSWITLADAFERAGADVAVLRSGSLSASVPLLPLTAHAGRIFHGRFYLSTLRDDERHAERPFVRAFCEAAGIPVGETATVWEGQADVLGLPGSRYILTFGPGSAPESASEVKAWVSPGAPTLELEIDPPFRNGQDCLSLLWGGKGRPTLLYVPGAFRADPTADLRAFCGDEVALHGLSDADVRAHATQGVVVGQSWIAPFPVSTALRDHAGLAGLAVCEADVGELLGEDGGGPRLLLNDLGGLRGAPPGASYRELRHGISRAVNGGGDNRSI